MLRTMLLLSAREPLWLLGLKPLWTASRSNPETPCPRTVFGRETRELPWQLLWTLPRMRLRNAWRP
jgi:hypothetical protein